MASKVKVTVSVDEGLAQELRRVSRRTGRPTSHLVEEAIRLWRRSQLEQALRDGYQAMAKEDRATAARHLRAGREAWR